MLSGLPRGGSLGHSTWRVRHRGILLILWCHALGIPAFGLLYAGAKTEVCLGAGVLLAGLAAAAQLPIIPRRVQSAIATCGLMTASAILVHLSGGYIELHFHFFVMMSVIVLYQDWVPFLVGLIYVVIDHGLLGTYFPMLVYNHHAAQTQPWTWALVHGSFILAQSTALLYFWRINEVAQTAALDSEARTRMVIETALDAVVTTDVKGTITEWNAQAELMFDVCRGDAIGRSLTAYLSAEPSSAASVPAPPVPKPLPGAVLNRRVEMVGCTSAGQKFPVEIAMSCLAIGGVQHFTIFIQDISVRKEQEAALCRAKNAAESASLAKSQFLANMSHEIRTPMNGVLGMTELLMATSLNEKQRRYAETVHRSGTNLLHIINDILDFSKIEAGRMELEHVPYNLRDVLDETLELYREQAARKQLALTVCVEDNVPTFCQGDPHRLRQIVTNLVGNALKFTERGGVYVTVRLQPGSGDIVLTEIRDTGIGIPPESQARVFDSFSQADGSTTRRFGGTGLGLAIVKQLVEMMGGRVDLESFPGQGTTFRFTIPVDTARCGTEARHATTTVVPPMGSDRHNQTAA